MVGQACCAAEHVARRIGASCLSWAIGSDVNLLPHLSLENRRFFRHTVRHLDTLLTNSDDLRRAVLALCPDAGRVHVNYKGIDLRPLTDLPSREACRQKLRQRAEHCIHVLLRLGAPGLAGEVAGARANAVDAMRTAQAAAVGKIRSVLPYLPDGDG